MCFVSTPKTAETPDPNVAANTAAEEATAKRRNAKGYGSTLLTGGLSSSTANLGRQTIAGQ